MKKSLTELNLNEKNNNRGMKSNIYLTLLPLSPPPPPPKKKPTKKLSFKIQH